MTLAVLQRGVARCVTLVEITSKQLSAYGGLCI